MIINCNYVFLFFVAGASTVRQWWAWAPPSSRQSPSTTRTSTRLTSPAEHVSVSMNEDWSCKSPLKWNEIHGSKFYTLYFHKIPSWDPKQIKYKIFTPPVIISCLLTLSHSPRPSFKIGLSSPNHDSLKCGFLPRSTDVVLRGGRKLRVRRLLAMSCKFCNLSLPPSLPQITFGALDRYCGWFL